MTLYKNENIVTNSIRWFGLWLNNNVDVAILAIAIIIVIPFYILSQWCNNIYWQKVTIVSIAALIVYYRLKSSPLLIILHVALIIIGFLLLFLAFPFPWLFVLLCASMAAFTIRLAGWDSDLRTFGNFTFIPALYLACEFNHGFAGEARLQEVLNFIPYIAYATIPVLILSIYNYYYSYNAGQKKSLLSFMLQLYHKPRSACQGISFIEPLIAITLAVSLSALLVEAEEVTKGQWLIWSSASVITGEISTVSRKLRDRAIGAMVGVPLGIILGTLLPHTTFYVNLGSLCTLLTLVAFRNYVLGFGSRCCFIALVITLMNEGVMSAGERILNVLLGGIIGVSIFYITHKTIEWRKQTLLDK